MLFLQCVVFSRWPWWRRVDRGEAISKNKPPGSPTDLQFFRGFQSEVPGSSHPLEMSRLQKSSELPKTAVQSGDRDGSGHCNLRDIAGSEATVDWLPVSGRISGRRDGVKRARTGIAGTEHIAVFGESPLRNLGILSTQDLAVPGSPNFGDLPALRGMPFMPFMPFMPSMPCDFSSQHKPRWHSTSHGRWSFRGRGNGKEGPEEYPAMDSVALR